jgi:anti-sigma factor RsiW
MSCTELHHDLDDWLDGTLDAARARALDEHVATCADCTGAAARARALAAALRAQPVPAPRDGLFAAALERAARTAEGRAQRRAVVRAGVSSALAAGLLVFAATAFWLRTPAPSTTGNAAVVSMAVAEVRTVNLVFAADAALEGVSLTVHLPEGVEVQGFAGRREIEWRTRLAPGNNVLALPLVATGLGGGTLVAELGRGDERKSFTVNIDIS